MADKPLRILVLGAHPDDCDIKAGGIAIKYSGLEHQVRFVSVTNGDAGHHEIGGVELARKRRAEAEAASNVGALRLGSRTTQETRKHNKGYLHQFLVGHFGPCPEFH